MELKTKKDYAALLMKILAPLKGKYSNECAFLDVGSHRTWYDETAARMEAFARPLWGLVPFWAGGGSCKDLEDIYVRGLCSGPDRDGAEYWGDCGERDQRFVEMAAIAFGMLFCPEKVWEPLGDGERKTLVKWLWQINEKDVCDSNWRFFRIMTNIALKKHGMKYSAEKLSEDLARIDEFYLGDGWYKDGQHGECDYYIAFAFHFYGLVYAVVMEDEDPERCAVFKERAELFAKEFIYWFDENGKAVPYGRSMAYRFAQAAFWSMCVVSGIRPYSLGVMKGIISRHLRDWFKNDNIFDNGGVLTVGYKYNQLTMAENYNAPGSPYWGLKVFAVLMLDDDHEFWSAEEEPLPKLDALKKLEKANMLVSRLSGSVTLYPAGTNDNFSCGLISYKYLKFAYSSFFGFSVSKGVMSLEENAPDSSLVFELDGMIMTRRKNISYEITDDCITIRWSPFMGIEVETKIIPDENGHRREHTITSEYECRAYDCGFAVSNMDADKCVFEERDGLCSVSNKTAECMVSSDSGRGRMINANPNTCVVSPKTLIPAVEYNVKKGVIKVSCTVREKVKL